MRAPIYRIPAYDFNAERGRVAGHFIPKATVQDMSKTLRRPRKVS